MASEAEVSAADRIDRAIARIEAASSARERATTSITERHAVLRDRIADAIAALDAVLADGGDS